MVSGDDGEQRLPEPVTGKDPGGGPTGVKSEHHEHFNRALDDAIEQIAGKDWPKPASYDVTVTLEARIDVENPAGVGEYRVTIR